MKKLLIITLVLVLAMGVCLFGACVNDEEQHVEHTYDTAWSHDDNYHFKKCTYEGCDSVSEKATHNFINDTCSCGYFNGAITATPSTVTNLIATASDGQTIILGAGVYPSITVAYVENLTIKSDEDVVVAKIIVESNVKNLVVDGVAFDNSTDTTGGIKIEKDLDGLFVKNCSFTDNVNIVSKTTVIVQNVVIENTSFKDLTTGLTSAINLHILYNYTVKNCVFDNIAYNAMQVGNHEIGGDIVVTGNMFKNITSRVIYFVTPTDVASCDVSGNTFDDNSGCNKDTGHYVKAGGVGITIGANTWEVIPLATETNFEGISNGYIVYNQSEQLSAE